MHHTCQMMSLPKLLVRNIAFVLDRSGTFAITRRALLSTDGHACLSFARRRVEYWRVVKRERKITTEERFDLQNSRVYRRKSENEGDVEMMAK